MPDRSGAGTAWRRMQSADLPAVVALADVVHPTLHEDVSVFRDRLELFPDGCLVLGSNEPSDDPRLLGYAVGHPWRGLVPPKLDTALGALPASPDGFFVHDVVIASTARGRGLANGAIERLLELAKPFDRVSLVSVYGTTGFWGRFGFSDISEELLPGTLEPYGSGARLMISLLKQ